jgi:hypothetical protein
MRPSRALVALALTICMCSASYGMGRASGGKLLQIVPGIYPFPANGQAQDVASVQASFGAPLARTLQFIPYGSWAQFAAGGTAPIVAGMASEWAVPLTVVGTSLAQVAAGAGDSYFLQLARNIIANDNTTGPIEVRFGWEFNGYDFGGAAGFFPWYAIGPNAPVSGAADYVTSFRRAVGIFRGVSPRFIFSWDVQCAQGNGAGGYVDPTPAYPGNAYVDVIAGDVYFDRTTDNADPAVAFGFRVHSAGFGLDWVGTYARQQGKLLAVDEWGINSDSYASIIIMMAEWLRSQQVYAHNYWMSNANFAGFLFGQYPTAAANFVAEFNTQ